MVLLNLVASLSLVAAVGVPAVVSSQSEIQESSVSYLNRKNSSGFVNGYVYQALDASYDANTHVLFDGVLPRTDQLYYSSPDTFSYGYCVGLENVSSTGRFIVSLLMSLPSSFVSETSVFVYDGQWKMGVETSRESYSGFVGIKFGNDGSIGLQDYYHVVVMDDSASSLILRNYLESKNIVPSITSGLGVVSNLASGLVGGFDSLALNDGALTNVMAFAFTLLGIGTAVGVAKLCFNWVTGRHGM